MFRGQRKCGEEKMKKEKTVTKNHPVAIIKIRLPRLKKGDTIRISGTIDKMLDGEYKIASVNKLDLKS
jgi:hypothetical protein